MNIHIISCILCCFITNIVVFLYFKVGLKLKIFIMFIFDIIYILTFMFFGDNIICKYFILVNIIVAPIVSIINDYSFKSSTNYGWKKISKFPVLGNLKTGSFFDPYVIKVNNEYYMYFSDRKHGCIALSKSSDGINRDPPVTVLLPSNINDWENIVNRACVLYKDNKFLMWYSGQFDGKSCIGYAESVDGIIFKKYNKNPILIPELDFEGESIMNPNVIYDNKNGLFKLYYAAGEQYEPDCVGYAESTDGIKRKKNNSPVLEKSEEFDSYDCFKVGATDVHIMDNDIYVMFYIGYTDINTARIMFATSDNGIKWRKNKDYLIQSSKFGFDGDAVYKPSAIYDKELKKWMMRYNGRLSDREYIGCAECTGHIFNGKIGCK